jgi:hypothetical protein
MHENQWNRIEEPDMNLPTWYLTKETKIYDGEKKPLQQMLLGKLGICMQKTDTKSMSFSLYKDQLKVDW